MLTMWHKESSICDRHIGGKGFIGVVEKYCKNNDDKLTITVNNVYSSCRFNEKLVMRRFCL